MVHFSQERLREARGGGGASDDGGFPKHIAERVQGGGHAGCLGEGVLVDSGQLKIGEMGVVKGPISLIWVLVAY